MNGLFITGTDTGVGKTVVTGLLARYLSEEGYSVITQKWIQTGCRAGISDDIKTHLRIMGKDKRYVADYLDLICPYTFKMPASPHLASRAEGKSISSLKIIKAFKSLSNKFDFVLVEGVGGALVPYDQGHLVIDIVKDLSLPVLVVAQNKLGAINHTLLTIEALRARKLKILGIVFNNVKGENKRILNDNPRIIKALSKDKVIGALPWISGLRKI